MDENGKRRVLSTFRRKQKSDVKSKCYSASQFICWKPGFQYDGIRR